jgi:Spy/CpxP family protein refolding chaperone
MMRFGIAPRWIAVTSLVLGAAQSATAQSGGAGQADAHVGFERRPQLSLQDELNQTDAILSRMEKAATTVRRQLDTTRVARDVVKSLCLSDRLSQIEVAARSAKDRQGALRAAARRSDIELRHHEFTILTALGQRADQLSAEANQCIGEEAAFVGATQVTTAIDPNLPGEDTTEYPPTFVLLPFGEPCSCSPYN